jgi:hypothetical protein
MKKTTLTDINTYLIVALLIAVGMGLYFTLSTPTPKAPVIPPAREVHIMLLGSDCEDCFNASAAIDFVKASKDENKQTLNVTDVKLLTIEESKAHIEKYGISRLPAVVVTGNVSGLVLQNFESKEDALIFSQAPPPYYDVAEKRVKGKVNIIILEDDKCEQCFNVSSIAAQLAQIGINVASKRTVDAKSSEGKELTSTYKIEKVPTIIFNKDALEYDMIKQVWSQVGSEESDGKLVLRVVSPPYINVSTGKVDGIVDLTYLVDETCTQCYNVTMMKEMLSQSFNMKFEAEKTADVSSTKGKSLIKKYNIELVPTVILSKDAAAYPTMGQAWPQAGTVETDGTYVLRNLYLLEGQIYKNLTSGELVGKKEEAEISAPAGQE